MNACDCCFQKYTHDSVWCDIAFYACIFGTGFLIVMITINWFAQLRYNVR